MANVDGSWNTVTKSPMGDQQAVLTVASSGDSFTGSFVGGLGSVVVGVPRGVRLGLDHRQGVFSGRQGPAGRLFGRWGGVTPPCRSVASCGRFRRASRAPPVIGRRTGLV